MEELDRPDRPHDKESRSFDWMIPLAGMILVLFATAIIGLFPRTPNNILIAIALFGVGCAALWFGLMHGESEKTRHRIEQLNERTERVRNLLEKSKK
jgi:hypothetical protein